MFTKLIEAGGRQRFAGIEAVALLLMLLPTSATAWCEQRAAAGSVAERSKGMPQGIVPASRPTTPSTGDYTVMPEDTIDVNIMSVPELSRTYRVSSNGYLALPLVPQPFLVSGLSATQLEHLIAEKYKDAGMISNAVVTVTLHESRLHAVLVTGEVARPESATVYGPTQLLDVLVQAGGLSPDASDDVIITRGEMGLRADAQAAADAGIAPRGRSFTLNVRKLVLTGDDDATNVLLYPGDHLSVQRAELVYIMGAVNRPGGYVLNESRQDITVMKLMAMAGDVNGNAKRNHIVLLRHEPSTPPEKRNQIPVDYKGIVKGQIPDMRLQPDDILYVPESTSLKAMRTGVSSAVSIATGGASWLLIYR